MTYRATRRMGVLAVVLAVLLAVAPALAADEPIVLDYDPKSNPVADRTVHITVNKQDRDTFEYVEGAHLQIIDKQTGEVATWQDGNGEVHRMDWISGDESFESARGLDVDHAYILREVEAPEGYKKADDVEFVLRSVNFETKGEVLSGATTQDGSTNAEFRNISGSIEEQSFVISLYDQKIQGEITKTITKERENKREVERHDSQTIVEHDSTQESNTNNVERHDEDSTSNSRTVVTSRHQEAGNTIVRTVQDQNVVVTSSEAEVEHVRTGGGNLTKTGDDTSYAAVLVLALLGAGTILVATQYAHINRVR